MKNESNTIHETYMEHLFWKNGIHPFYSQTDGQFNAYIKNIDSSGRLILEKESGKKKAFLFKEVKFLL